MSDSIPDLWPDEYSDREAISPEELLRAQAEMLAERTKHLVASVKRTDDGKTLILEFMLSLADGTRTTRLCSMYHPVERCYPVRLYAEGLGYHVANTQQQLLTLLAEVLRNPLVRSGVESLRATALARQAESNGSPRTGETPSARSSTQD